MITRDVSVREIQGMMRFVDSEARAGENESRMTAVPVTRMMTDVDSANVSLSPTAKRPCCSGGVPFSVLTPHT